MVYSLMGHDVQVQNIVFLSQGTYLITRLGSKYAYLFSNKKSFRTLIILQQLG
jgi:hypothetical protein